MAANYWQLVHPERLVVLAVMIGLTASLVVFVLTKVGVRRSTAVFTVFIATIVFMRGGQLLWQFDGVLGWLAILLPVTLAAVVAARLGDHVAVRMTAVALAVALGVGPLISMYGSLQQLGPDLVLETSSEDVELAERPNVFLIVVDGYPGLLALEQNFGMTRSDLTSNLQQRRFQVPESVWSPYWSTDLAVPSMLQMSYPVEEGGRSPNTRRRLHEIIGGDNHLVEILKTNGYETVMVEAGWTGSSCGPEFDRCIPSPWLDDLLFGTLWEGAARRLVLARWGHGFTVGTQGTIDWLESNASEISSGETPTFVFAHLIAPHPPFFLDANCETVVTDERIGDRFLGGGVDPVTRERFFFDQVDCVDGFMVRLADLTDTRDVVIFVSDHGTDRYDPFDTPGGQWSPEAIVERMNVFAAVRTGRACDIGDHLVTPNLIRRVVSCYATSTLEDVPNRLFLPSILELGPEEVEALLHGA